MMINKITVENFRSIGKVVINYHTPSKFKCFVGQNNAGKSNILRAINLFFNKKIEPGLDFNSSKDIPKNESKKKPTISIEFKFNPTEDNAITSFIDRFYASDFLEYTVPITLVRFKNQNFQYTFTNKLSQKKNMPDLLERILSYVDCIYIPAIKDYNEIVKTEFMKRILPAIFRGRGVNDDHIKVTENRDKFRNSINGIQEILDQSSEYVSDIITSTLPQIERLDFRLPYDDLEEFLGKINFEIKEIDLINSINLENQGSGIQGFTIYTMLKLLHEMRSKQHNAYKKSKFIWLIEEPETFMHNDLQRKTFNALKEYSTEGHIFITTHSPVFIDKRDYSNTYMVYKEETTKTKRINTKTIMQVITGTLGVSFQDVFLFNKFNILVEGETDKTLILGMNQLFKEANYPYCFDEEQTDIIICSSASSIPHFYHTYNAFNQFADFIALFDRDKAGIDARSNILKKNPSVGKNLILIPNSFREGGEIEDLVEKDVWDEIVRTLADEDLVIIQSKKGGEIIDYSPVDREESRVKSKIRFAELLLEYAKKDLSKFSKWEELLKTIHDITVEEEATT